jgi:ribosomal protein S18 acetylase RimI-like enzyme
MFFERSATPMSLEIRLLTSSDDQARLESFLDRHIETSVFLRSNVMAAGLVDRGEPLQATYVAAFAQSDVVGVAAHSWNGNILVQAPTALEDVVRQAVKRSGRAVNGIIGPYQQVVSARTALGLNETASHSDGRERLFSLRLSDLVVPEALASGALECRGPHANELALLASWRADYCIETLGGRDGPELRAQSAEIVARLQRGLAHWVLLAGNDIVSYSAFNARLPGIAQIGGVFTPRALRSRGYARAVVAGSLLGARRDGVERAILFTPEANTAAQRAYQAIGFRHIGDFGLLLFQT